MRIVIITITLELIFCFSSAFAEEALAQEEAVEVSSSKEDQSANKVQILVGPDQQLQPQEKFFFAGQKRSGIEWENLEEKKFLSLSLWKNELSLKNKEAKWRRNLMERRLKEKVGYVLECVGECRLYRDLGYSKVDYLSTIREGDELSTQKDSYLWVYMLDGTLMRVAPNGSVTVKEINIGVKENFIYTRLNAGNILWWSRQTSKFKAKSIKETDTLFLPLSMYDAKGSSLKTKLDEDNLYSFLENKNNFKKKFKRLNSLVEESNKIYSKATLSLLVFPNGTVLGKGIVAEFIVLISGKSYFKQRTAEELGLQEGADDPELNFYYRGFDKEDNYPIEAGRWYEVGKRGRSILTAENPRRFAMGEFVTRNIPTILTARELLFQRYSLPFHTEISEINLARKFGYRQWGENDRSGDDLNLRLKFLKEYTRRAETTNLVMSEQFRKKLKERGEPLKHSVYSADFYRRAIGNFYNYREGVNILSGRNESLNSERKPFWKLIHGIKD